MCSFFVLGVRQIAPPYIAPPEGALCGVCEATEKALTFLFFLLFVIHSNTRRKGNLCYNLKQIIFLQS